MTFGMAMLPVELQPATVAKPKRNHVPGEKPNKAQVHSHQPWAPPLNGTPPPYADVAARIAKQPGDASADADDVVTRKSTKSGAASRDLET